MNTEIKKPVYYADYLQLDKILDAQTLESQKAGVRADDEMLFIVIHQTYELWFKEILHELNIIREVFLQDAIEDNQPHLYGSVHRLKRVIAILEVLVSQMGVLETMTPLDFLDFRDLLKPASGFQSIQFKMIEALLGLHFEKRQGKQYYISQLTPQDVERVKQVESEQSLLVLINKWLERMPYAKSRPYWMDNGQEFWQSYREALKQSLSEGEMSNLTAFDALFMPAGNYPEGRALSVEANKNALFIMLYRDYPLLQLPYDLLNALLEIDEGLSLWRHRHIHLVQRTIGKRVGTGGSTGAEYLRGAADTHYIFKELAELTSFLIPRHLLPVLPTHVVADLCYRGGE